MLIYTILCLRILLHYYSIHINVYRHNAIIYFHFYFTPCFGPNWPSSGGFVFVLSVFRLPNNAVAHFLLNSLTFFLIRPILLKIYVYCISIFVVCVVAACRLHSLHPLLWLCLPPLVLCFFYQNVVLSFLCDRCLSYINNPKSESEPMSQNIYMNQTI
jgi:hypothetical protein